MFLFAILVGLTLCNWHQYAHDEKWSFQSSFEGMKKDWSIAFQDTKTSQFSLPFLIDDHRGNLWIMEESTELYDWQSWVKIIDVNTGSVVQEFKANVSYVDNCNGLFYNDKFIIYNTRTSRSEENYYIQGLNIDGTTDWIYPIPKETTQNSIITNNGVLIYVLPQMGSEITDFLIAQPYGSSEQLWNMSFPLSKEYKYDFFNTLGDNFYFQTENEDFESHTRTWYMIDIPTGKIVSTYEYERGGSIPFFSDEPFVIDADRKQGYIVDNTFGDASLVCLSTDNLKVKWKTEMKGKKEGPDMTCSRTFLEENRLYLFCEQQDGGERNIFGCEVDNNSGKQGDCVHFITIDSMDGWMSVNMIKDGEYILKFDFDGQYDRNNTLYVVETGIKTVKKLDVEKNILQGPISDAQGCIYYCYGPFGETTSCKKKC